MIGLGHQHRDNHNVVISVAQHLDNHNVVISVAFVLTIVRRIIVIVSLLSSKGIVRL